MKKTTQKNDPRGYLIPIGGGVDKEGEAIILNRVVELAKQNGPGNLVVIPTASQEEDTGPLYVELFKKMGVETVDEIAPENRADCSRQEYLDRIDQTTAIFFTGGNQLRLSTRLRDTPLAEHIRKVHYAGTHIAGTSAGAAILADHMISGGHGGSTPTRYGVDMSAGLGFTNKLIIDQHFRERDRIGRLMAALFYCPGMVGIGIDEDTAAFIKPNGVFEVVGSGAITIVDASEITYSSVDTARPGKPVSLIGLKVHILVSGAHFDILERSASPN